MNTFAALASPTRCRIVEELANGQRTAGELRELFSLSQPAVSQHLRVLRDVDLVAVRVDAQRRVYSLNAGPLRQIDQWLDRYRRFWVGKLDDLERYMDEEGS